MSREGGRIWEGLGKESNMIKTILLETVRELIGRKISLKSPPNQ